MAVFVREQGIALDDELNPNDAKHQRMLHLMNRQPVGCSLDGQGQIGRMAVLQQHRHRESARRYCTTLSQRLGAGTDRIFLHAQKDAERFYAEHGFIATGEASGGISHITA